MLFARGMICGLAEGGFKQEEIVARVKKKDRSHPTLRAVEATLAKARDDPDWRGTDTAAGGRPRELSVDGEKQLVDLVFAERGQAKVTTSYCKRRVPFLRRMSKQATCNASSGGPCLATPLEEDEGASRLTPPPENLLPLAEAPEAARAQPFRLHRWDDLLPCQGAC